MNELSKLKERGNDAFKSKKFDKAIDLFKKAIEIEEESPLKDAKLLAVLQSNIAQAYLELKNYDEAVIFASLSISHDPLFVKSVLRRGLAQYELGHYSKATLDFRSVLKADPKHPKAIQLMRQITGYELNSESMRSAYVRHYFRRSLIKFTISPNDSIAHMSRFNRSMIRVSFLSSFMARVTNYFWSNGHLTFETDTMSGYFLRSWFVNIYVRIQIKDSAFGTIFYTKSLEAVFAVVQPKNVSLFIESFNPLIEKTSSIYKFDAVFYKPIFNELLTGEPSQRFLDDITRTLKHLTVIPCLDELIRLPDSNFAKMDTLFVGTRGITLDFLNSWEQRKWSIETLVCGGKYDLFPNCKFFDPLSDSVRGKVKSLCYMFACDSDPGFINNDNMKAAYRDLTILKNAFPSISQFIGEFIFIFSDAEFRSHFFRCSLKGHIRWLVTTFDAEKIRFGDRPKVVTWVTLQFKRSERIYLEIEAIKRVVKECRQDMPQIESISFSHTRDGFDWIPIIWSHVVIDIKAKGIDFQVAIKKGCE